MENISVLFLILEWMHESSFFIDSCIIDIAVRAFFLCVICNFSCVTLHFVSLLSYLEHSVWCLEFICLCSIHRFRYYMIFSTKVDMEFVLDALYWWAVLSFLLFPPWQMKWLQLCDYLAFGKSCVCNLGIFLYVYDSIAQWICDCFNQINF